MVFYELYEERTIRSKDEWQEKENAVYAICKRRFTMI